MGVHELYWPVRSSSFPPSFSATSRLLQDPEAGASQNFSWRASVLPSYKGPETGPVGFRVDGSSPAPYQGHRWLPVRELSGNSSNTTLSPVSTITSDPRGPGIRNWAVAAQIHYSFLHHLEQGDTWRYKFDVWDCDYRRLAINLFAIRGRDVLDAFPFPTFDDEEYLTNHRPRELGRRVIVDGTGLAVHFGFNWQRSPHGNRALTWTDLFERYQGYAAELGCPVS